MSILGNFVNPWESNTVVLESEAIKINALEHNTLNTPKHNELAYFFDKNGDFVGAFKADQDYIKIIREKSIKKSIIKETYKSKTDTYAFRATLLKDSDILTRKSFYAKDYSKIFTTILKEHGYDVSKIYNSKISVKNGNYFYNDPDRAVGFANTDISLSKFKISINIWQVFPHYKKVSNVISSLGVHEYTGHGINRWRKKDNNHYKAYELEFEAPTWKKTTNHYKAQMIGNYLDLIEKELGVDAYYKKHDEYKKKYGHLKELDYVWNY